MLRLLRSGPGTWLTRFGAATRLSLIWGLPDAPEAFLGAARGDRVCEGFSDACVKTLSARADGRRTKSANGRNRAMPRAAYRDLCRGTNYAERALERGFSRAVCKAPCKDCPNPFGVVCLSQGL